MPRKPDPFQELADRLMDRVVFPALENNLFPLLDDLFRNVLPPKPPPQRPAAPKRRRINPAFKWSEEQQTRVNRARVIREAKRLEPTHYDVLQVSPRADQEVIRAAYRNLCMRSHPDRHPGDKAAEERFKRIAAAYEILSDAAKRAAYDRTLSFLG